MVAQELQKWKKYIGRSKIQSSPNWSRKRDLSSLSSSLFDAASYSKSSIFVKCTQLIINVCKRLENESFSREFLVAQ